jgi:putative ABC transport system substrate-binding protein
LRPGGHARALDQEPRTPPFKAATATIPIIFSVGGDPVELGLVDSFNRPGRNATGFAVLTVRFGAKAAWAIARACAACGHAHPPKRGYPPAEQQLRDLQEAARANNLPVQVLRAGTDHEINAAFEAMAQQRNTALLVAPFFDTRRNRLVALSASSGVPTMYQFREFAGAAPVRASTAAIARTYRMSDSISG